MARVLAITASQKPQIFERYCYCGDMKSQTGIRIPSPLNSSSSDRISNGKNLIKRGEIY